MAASIFDESARSALLARVMRLQAGMKPRWGKMSANQMVVHCTCGIEMMIGGLKVAPKPGPFRNPLLRYLVIHVMPWPKGAPTAPELIPGASPGDFETNKKKLRASIEKIGARDPEGPFDPHPAFGDIRGKNLGVLSARHLDHHLRQFGI